MNRLYTLLILLAMLLFHPVAVFAYPVLDVIDLYPYGSEIATGLAYSKGILYATGAGSYVLYSIDASDPYDLVYIIRTGAGQDKAYDPVVADDKLYVASWFSGLRVYNISNPGYFSLLWAYNADTAYAAYWGVDVYRERAYATASAAPNSAYYGMRILDIAETGYPNPNDRLVGFLNTSDRNVDGVAVRGSYAYYTDGESFEVANISDETNPYIMKQFYFPDSYNFNGVCLNGDYAYVYGRGGTPNFIVFDISDPTNPVNIKEMPNGLGASDVCLFGDYALLATSGLVTLNVTNPANPTVVSTQWLATYQHQGEGELGFWENSVVCNGLYAYVGTQECYNCNPETATGDNYYRGKVYSLKIFTTDPDDTGPEIWSDISTGEASWDTQYEGETLPTSADPAWQVYEGSESWASVTDGKLRVNDTGTGSNDRIRWWRNWEATNSHGTTVLVRARCASYQTGGGGEYPTNIYIEDGRGREEFAILSDKIRLNISGFTYPLDGTQWHTYRITTQGSDIKVYVDGSAIARLDGSLNMSTERARIMFGSGSGPARQDIYFDYVHFCSNGDFGPAEINDFNPDISAKVADVAGTGSLSGIVPASVRVYWSTDDGESWSESGGALWDCLYEADELPTAAVPPWTEPEGNNVNSWISSGILHVEDTSTAGGTKVKWARSWGASPSTGATLLARVKCNSAGGDPTYYGNLFIDDGSYRERFAILPDRIEAKEAGIIYNDGGTFNGTVWHQYRITTKNSQFTVYVDEDPTPVMTGTMVATSTQNRVMFGVGASTGTQYVEFDYVYYTAVGDLPTGQGGGGGAVTVTCTGQPGDDRGLVIAYGVPFNQVSSSLNKIKFSLRDIAGNTGFSPIYNVHIGYPPSPDMDHDLDVDQEDFGLLQECFSGDGILPVFGCEDADLDGDLDVDDAIWLQQCMGGANLPIDPGCPSL
ncbi:MAG: LVIVD repeat-containing protein [Planctomycetota bacterium]|jgi:hypothetical protein